MTYTPASAPLVIQSFRPFRMYRSPRFSARVASPKASEPEPASESAYEPTVPLVSIERYLAFCASLP